ncbi:MAG: hypothetical protein HYZ75_09675 [Elusimicrobia bacterium]|nr:hypothetical protein [Elusimicrobiota bacterium]
MRFLVAALAAVSLTGCLYTDVRMPRAYRSATPADVKAAPADAAVTGRSCMRSLLFLFAWGDAGYAAAARDALKESPDAVLYDVKSDVKLNSYLLGLYSQSCTIVTGRAGRP